MMMKNPNLKKQSQNLRREKSKIKQKTQGLGGTCLILTSQISNIIPIFFNINTNINIKSPKNFNINIKINILEMHISISKSKF